MEATHYEVLGVTEDASASDVRAAYLRRAKLLHPDRHAGRSAREVAHAEARMQAVNTAWAVLGDPAQRADYDHARRAVVDAGIDESPTGWVDTDDEPFVPEGPVPLRMAVLRALPLLGLLAVLALIFVFTAYAGSGR